MDLITTCRVANHEGNQIVSVCLQIGCQEPIRTMCQKCLAEQRHNQHTKKQYQEFKNQYAFPNGGDSSIQEIFDILDKTIKGVLSLREHLQNQSQQYATLSFPDEETFTKVNEFVNQVVEQEGFKKNASKKLSDFIITLSQDFDKMFHNLQFEYQQKIIPKGPNYQHQKMIILLQDKAKQLYKETKYDNAYKAIMMAIDQDPNNLTTIQIQYDIQRALQKHQDAIQSCNRVLSKQLDDKAMAEWFDNRAFCYRHGGQKEYAEIDLMIACKLDPSRIDIKQKQKYLYNAQGFDDLESFVHRIKAFSHAFLKD